MKLEDLVGGGPSAPLSKGRLFLVGVSPGRQLIDQITVSLEGGSSNHPSHHIIKAHGLLLPLRFECLDACVFNADEFEGGEEHRALLEVNRALKDGGALIYISKRGDERIAERLLSAGFAVEGQPSQAIEEFGELSVRVDVYRAYKAWRKYVRESCPRCGGRMILPLIPSDSKASKVWNLYCSGCSFTWNIEEPLTEWV